MSKDSEYQKQVLEAMLEEEDNKGCAECNARGPRWCSTNLGVFLCIRCSGIHRKMGTHISKVKSVTLDKWKREQLDHFKRIGNRRAIRKYENNMPEHARPHPTDDFAMEQFIRDKYERKKWYKKSSHAESEPPKRESRMQSESVMPKVENKPTPKPAPVASAPMVDSLLNFNTPPPTQTFTTQPPQTVSTELLFGLNTLSPNNQPTPSSISKDQLLSLYAKPIAPTQQTSLPILNPQNIPQNNQPKPNYNVRVGGTVPMGTMGTMGTMPMGTMPMGTVPLTYATIPNQTMYYNPNQVLFNPLAQPTTLYRN